VSNIAVVGGSVFTGLVVVNMYWNTSMWLINITAYQVSPQSRILFALSAVPPDFHINPPLAFSRIYLPA